MEDMVPVSQLSLDNPGDCRRIYIMAALQRLQSPGGDLVLWYNKANHAISGSVVLVHSDTAEGLVVDFLSEFVLPLHRTISFFFPAETRGSGPSLISISIKGAYVFYNSL